jgi:hypothetical protein
MARGVRPAADPIWWGQPKWVHAVSGLMVTDATDVLYPCASEMRSAVT